MRITFDLTGTNRKALVRAISEITGAQAVYKFTPTYAYEIDYFTVTRDGALEFDDRADSEEIETLLEGLAERGFTAAEMPDTGEDTEAEKASEECPTEPQDGTTGLTVAIPLDYVAVGNLTSLLDAKGSLIQKALGIPATPIEVTEDSVKFPWFTELPEPDEVRAYTHFIAALCRMSVTQKRINAKEKAVDNEKYAFRCFLLRLGFIGSEYKTERKILLRNLAGSSAFKSGSKDKTESEVTGNEISE